MIPIYGKLLCHYKIEVDYGPICEFYITLNNLTSTRSQVSLNHMQNTKLDSQP